jgi:hypothetical protein
MLRIELTKVDKLEHKIDRVNAYQIPYYSRGIEEAKRTRPRFADCIWFTRRDYLSYLYCSSKLVLAHAVLLKKNNLKSILCSSLSTFVSSIRVKLSGFPNMHWQDLFTSRVSVSFQNDYKRLGHSVICLRTKFWLEDVILTVATATMI